MRKLINKLFWVGALLLTLPSAWGFVPGGPVGNGGDAWQTPAIDYGGLMAPKNIGEEYRRVTPVMYYACDSSFLNYFGAVGSTNIDAAFGMMNNVLTNNVSSYSTDLSEFPMESQQTLPTAYAAGLTDLKSYTLELLVGQMGLASPDRYVWTLHDRIVLPPGVCPVDIAYNVIQRNLDVVNSPFDQEQYTPYVNGALFTYRIFENCVGVPLAGTINTVIPADPFASANTAVASESLRDGGFFVGLTRDDVAGLRYLLNSNNINWEATAPSGSLLLVTNVQAPITRTTFPISLLFSQASTNDPGTLKTNFPGITFLSVTTNIVTQITPTVTAYFTNLFAPFTNTVPFTNGVSVYQSNGIVTFPWSPVQYGNVFPLTTFPLGPLLALAPYTDPVTMATLYPNLLIGNVITNYLQVQIVTNIFPFITNQSVLPIFSNTLSGGLPRATHYTNIYYFTNQPGPTVINYDVTVPFTTISTLDLGVFSDLSLTNDPATMQALYPGLQILRATTSPAFVGVTNYVSYLTNLTGAPYQGVPILVTKPVSTNYAWITEWHYTFGNVFTNHYYTNRTVQVQSIWITNQIGAPYGSPFIAITNYKTLKLHEVSGDFFIIPTNWCGFDLTLAFPLSNPPYTYGSTNTLVYPGYNASGATGTNNVVGGNSYGLTQNYYDLYTNYNYAVYPGICEPVTMLGTNYTTNIVNTYSYTFANVITNHYYSNVVATVVTSNVQYIPFGSPDLLTNIVTTNMVTNYFPSGDFYIVPINWCGFQFISLLTNTLSATTTFVATNGSTTGTSSNSYSVTTSVVSTNYTYSVRPGVCEPALGFGTNYTTNVVTQYGYYFGGIVTNSYYTNSPVTVVTTNLAIWTNGLIGMLTNIVTATTNYNGISGDFFIPDPNWCGYNILTNQLQTVIDFTSVFAATNLPGVPDLGQRYDQTITTSYTNSILVIQPSTCDQVAPAPALRQGIEHVQFVRANYDSLLGQFFQPLTNKYSMVKIVNSQPVIENYQRVVTQPDFLLSAADLDGASSVENINFDQSTVSGGLAGPGTITPSTQITYDKVGPIFYNGPWGNLPFLNQTVLQFNPQTALDQLTQSANSLVTWASFDGSTNFPVLYPNGTSIANLINQIFLQVTPATVPDGTNGVAYSVTFTAAGGQPPYVWAAPGISTLVPGLSFDIGTQTLSGTPTAPGPFNFTLQVTDSGNRVINLNYSILIH